MNCAEFEFELQRRLDGRILQDDELLRAHRQICPACEESWDGVQILLDALPAWRAEVPDVDLVGAVVAAQMEHLSAEASNSSDGRRVLSWPKLALCEYSVPDPSPKASIGRYRWGFLGVAASIAALLAVGLLKPVDDGETVVGRSSALPQATVDIAKRGPAVPEAADREDVALLNQAGAAYGTLAKSAVGALEEFALIVIPIRLSEASPQHREDDHWIDGLQQQLRPLQEGLGEAWDFLREVDETPAGSRT